MLRPALFDNRSYKPMFFDDSFDKMVDDAFRDINIDLKNDLLTISASHKEEKDEEDQNKYIRKERCCRSYSRSFRVSNMEAGDIDASYNNGILEVTFPKKDPETKDSVCRIEIK